jgi:hypothetical protein
VGAPVFVAAAVIPELQFAIGIEIMQERVQMAIQMKEEYDAKVLPELDPSFRSAKIEFLCKDLRDVDWYDHADLVFITWTVFGEEISSQVTELCRKCKKGTLILTTTRRMFGDHIEYIAQEPCKATWGDSSIFIHRIAY